MTFEVGRVCIKTAGRDARKKCVIVEVLDSRFVTIDGETRRRKCNIAHLEPLNLTLDIKAGASNTAVVNALKGEGIVAKEKKKSEKQPQPRPKKVKKIKPKKKPKKATKKEEKPKKAAEKAPEKKATPKTETKPAKK